MGRNPVITREMYRDIKEHGIITKGDIVFEKRRNDSWKVELESKESDYRHPVCKHKYYRYGWQKGYCMECGRKK